MNKKKTPKKQKKIKTRKQKIEKYDIIILGGGIAGIYTMYQLMKHPVFSQKRILLLEKTERLGGRIYSTNPYPEKELIIEAGAGRFSQKHILLHKLITELNLENQIEKTSSESNYYPIHKKQNQNLDLNVNLDVNLLKPIENIIFHGKPKITELILKVIIFSKFETTEYLRTVSFSEYAEKKQILTIDEIKQIQDSFGFYSELVIMNIYDAIQLMENLDPTSNQFCTLKGGLSQINEKMIDIICSKLNRNPFRINQNVIRIQKIEQTEKYKIQTQNKTYKTEIIISALPKQVLERIPFFQPIYPWINKIKCSPLCRIYSRFKEPIWFKHLPKLTTNNNLRMIIPIQKEKGIIMISYTDNKFADYWNTIYIKDGIRKLNEELRKEIQESTNILIPREQ